MEKEALVLEKQAELVLEGLPLLTQQGFLLLELLALHQEPPRGKTFSWIVRLVVVWHSPLPLRLRLSTGARAVDAGRPSGIVEPLRRFAADPAWRVASHREDQCAQGVAVSAQGAAVSAQGAAEYAQERC